jgi:hypothetical protein
VYAFALSSSTTSETGPWLGIDRLDPATVKDWMLANLDRLHIYVPTASPLVLASLEMYVRARIGSVFEGSA